MSQPSRLRRSLAVILNPVAGNRRAGRAGDKLRQALERSKVDFELFETQRPRHAEAIVRELDGQFDIVVSAGGDGTLQEIATGIYRSGQSLSIAVIPMGTGNDFGDLIEMPHEIDEAIARIGSARVVPVDAGHVRWREQADGAWHDAVFLNAVGIGFDAMVASEAARFKRFKGKSAYLAGIVSALAKWPNPTVRLERLGPADTILPDGTLEPAGGEGLLHEGQLFLAAAGNGRTVGGGFRLTPHARANDGLLDMCFVEQVRKRRLPILIPKVIKGTHLGEPEIVSERLSGLRMVSPEMGLPLHFDGEVLTRTAVEVEVRVIPGAFQMLCPDASIQALADS